MVILTALLSLSCNKGKVADKTDLEKENLKGNIKCIQEYTFDIDSSGALTDSARWKNRDSMSIHTRYYNKSGFLTQWTNGTHADLARQVYTYNSSGRLVKVEYFTPDHLSYHRITSEYNTKGWLTEQKEETGFAGNTGSVEVRTCEKFDGKGNPLKVFVEANDNTGNFYSLYTYDEDSRRTKLENYGMDDKLISRFEYTYDKKGNTVSVKSRINDNEYHQTMVYDEKGNMIFMSDNVVIEGETYPVTVEYEYVYDPRENWIRRTRKDQGVKNELTERVIEYY